MDSKIWLAMWVILLLLTACGSGTTELTPESEISAVGTAVPPTEVSQTLSPQIATYNLGETTITQDHFPEDSQFREMPVRLNGVIGAPEETGTYPVVMIMHGSHMLCPDEMQWPCSEAEEQANYAGFAYLVEALAEAGYVALSINVNAEHTFAFGEAPMTVRTRQLIDRHLQALQSANGGTENGFGIDLTGKADLSQMVWIGHSRGADFVNWIAREQQLDRQASESGYGPLQGVVLLAPPVAGLDTLPAVDLHSALILPTCDADVRDLSGQTLYETARFDADRSRPFVSVYLEHANHNNFNTILSPDSLLTDRPDCVEAVLLTAEEQQTFLTQFVIDFLSTLYGAAEEQTVAQARLGWDVTQLIPTELYDLPVQIAIAPPSTNQLALMRPASKDEVAQNLLGGDTTMTNTTALFCPEGYYVPNMDPLSVPCGRVGFNQPGFPQQMRLHWETDGAEWRTAVTESYRDWRNYTAVQLRVAIDPLSDLNQAGTPQSFTIELVDDNGQKAHVVTPPIPYPIGQKEPNDFFDGDFFSGQVTMSTLRLPLAEFSGIDLENVSEIALVFDQTPGGALFFADLAVVR